MLLYILFRDLCVQSMMQDDKKTIWPWYLQEIEPTLKELGVPTPEELGVDKPEFLVPTPEAHYSVYPMPPHAV